MTQCELFDSPDVELYFYGELDAAATARVETHLRACSSCRQRLEDLHAIRRALASQPVVDAPPAGDWSGFMRRLDTAVGMTERRRDSVYSAGRTLRFAAALAATLAIAALGVFMAARARRAPPAPQVAIDHPAPAPTPPTTSGDRALREVSAEHLERSKLVVLGIATLDPARARPADWQYERKLAGALLSDTRLYRMAAQDRGLNDVAHVMRDLETVLIETSMSDSSDRGALVRVQKLIAKRDLVMKMQLAGTD